MRCLPNCRGVSIKAMGMPVPENTALFITGTDTNVGKTFCTALLAAEAFDSGRPVTVLKPIETGIVTASESDLSSIRQQLHQRVPDKVSLDETDTRWLETLSLYRFAEPAAPSVARVGQPIPLSELVASIQAACQKAHARGRLFLVEGAGGVAVPLNETPATYLDVMQALNYPVVLVSRPNLGTLNHTLLSVWALESAGLSLNRLIVNEGAKPLSKAESNSLAVRTVSTELKRLLPHLANRTAQVSHQGELFYTGISP
jgi:dethiobiotin synthetase